ncbi:MAG TPA: PAS domain S-box protein [Methylobacter sp.]|jgi:PAS domain S-box-containing protein
MSLLQREQDIGQQEHLLACVMRSIQDVVICINPQGVIVSVNPAVQQIFGYQPDELIGVSINRLMAETFHQRHEVHVADFSKSPTIKQHSRNVEAIKKNGDYFPVEIHVNKVVGSSEGMLFVASVRDISERKNNEVALARACESLEQKVHERTESLEHINNILKDEVSSKEALLNELSASEQRFRSITDSSPVMLWLADKSGRCHFFNNAWLAFTGRSLDEEKAANWEQLVHPDDQAKCINAYQQAMQERQVVHVEYRLKNKLGEYHWLLDSCCPQFNNNNEITGFIGGAVDITDRKQLELDLNKAHQETLALATRLQESDERFRLMADHAPVLIWVADEFGKFIYFNKPWLKFTGRTLEQELGDQWLENVHADDRETCMQQYMSAFKQKQPFRIVYRLKNVSGEFRWFFDSGVPRYTKGGDFSGYIGSCMDITEMKQMEVELEAARDKALRLSEAKSMFLANMSHEIRTPMNAIIGMGDLLAETGLTVEQTEYLRIFQRAAESLLNLINDILDLSKIEAGHLSLIKEDFCWHQLLESAVDMFALQAHQKYIELILQVDPDLYNYFCIGDPGRIRQIFVNIIGNALKFTEQGEIKIVVTKYRSLENYIHVAVQDTGIGILAEKQADIFGNFSQVDNSLTRSHSGTGLGLAICKQLVELMGGEIWIESNVGIGSTFHFTLCLPPSDLKKLSPLLLVNDDVVLANDCFEGKHILVVDDNSTNCLILNQILQSKKAQVTDVTSSMRALAELRRTHELGKAYDLAIIDCRMPEIDGFELAERIRATDYLVNLPVVMLTSDGRIHHQSLAKTYNFAAYLTKPVKKGELLNVLHNIFNASKTEVAEAAGEVLLTEQDSYRTLHILLVEDNEDNRTLIGFYLNKTAHQIDIAENGQVAVDKFKANRYDLVLMDIQMPVLDGYSATTQIRAYEQQQHLERTPILALTAYALKEEMEKCLKVGCDAHLTKPIKKDKLLAVINEYSLIKPVASTELELHLDPDLLPLIPNYLKNRTNDIAAMQQALSEGDFELILRLGHSMKGSGGGYGLDKISVIGAQLERLAKLSNGEAIREQIDELQQYTAALSQRFEDE